MAYWEDFLSENVPESEFIIETIRVVSKGVLQPGPVVAVGCLM
jgi:hypothetical protein